MVCVLQYWVCVLQCWVCVLQCWVCVLQYWVESCGFHFQINLRFGTAFKIELQPDIFELHVVGWNHLVHEIILRIFSFSHRITKKLCILLVVPFGVFLYKVVDWYPLYYWLKGLHLKFVQLVDNYRTWKSQLLYPPNATFLLFLWQFNLLRLLYDSFEHLFLTEWVNFFQGGG